MVDALGEIHRVLTPGGILVDARPDSRVFAYVERRAEKRHRRFGIVKTRVLELTADHSSDRAIARVIAQKQFAVRRRGRFWHRLAFDNLAEVRDYLAQHLRFMPNPSWVVDSSTRKRYADAPFAIRRAVRYALLEALKPDQAD